MTIVEFLLTRITEDEQVAMHAVNSSGYNPLYVWQISGETKGLGITGDRLLAECDAKRRIVEQLTHIEAGVLVVGTNHDEYRSALSFAVRVLALPYADHPDYQPDWRP